jgi:hypothetical protein
MVTTSSGNNYDAGHELTTDAEDDETDGHPTTGYP